MKKICLYFVLTLLAVGMLQAKEVIKIGVVTPMSGDVGDLCKELAIVIEKRAEEINKQPGLKYEYKFIFEDSKWDPKTSHMATTKLISVDHVDALIPVASLAAKITMPLTARAKIPQLALAYEECADGKYAFTYFATAGDLAKLSAETLSSLNVKSYAFVQVRQEATLTFEKLLKQYAEPLGIESKGAFYYNDMDAIKDFRTQLLKARETRADVYYIMASPAAIDVMLLQAKQLGGFEGKIISYETLDHVQDKKMLEGVWYSGLPLYNNTALAKLETYGINPKIGFTQYAYDVPTLLVEAFENAGNGKTKPTGDEVSAALRKMSVVNTLLGEVKQDDKGAFHPKPVLIYYERGTAREVSLEELKKIKGVK
jgi:ABC-type branched-subunit amino acid transport system substrate-binding protein